MVVTIISLSLIAIFIVIHYSKTCRENNQKIKQIFICQCQCVSCEYSNYFKQIILIIIKYSILMFNQNEISSSISSNSLTFEHQCQTASLTFSLRWDENKQSLYVRILNARDLFIYKRHRQPSIIDSYVRIEFRTIDDEQNSSDIYPSMRTPIIKQNPHPIYDELIEYPKLTLISSDNYSLILTVLTYDTFSRDQILGQIIFPIKSDKLNSIETIFIKTLTLRQEQFNEQQLGEMLISICYQPETSSLTIIVLKASNLPRIEAQRLLNPYFKIYMFYKQQRIDKKRSTIQRTTQTPVYNECFTFDIPNNDIENIYFDVILFDYDHHMKHEPIGMYSIGKELTQHWNDVCHRQVSKPMAHWYQLEPFHRSI